jgi:hypothetical protein
MERLPSERRPIEQREVSYRNPERHRRSERAAANGRSPAAPTIGETGAPSKEKPQLRCRGFWDADGGYAVGGGPHAASTLEGSSTPVTFPHGNGAAYNRRMAARRGAKGGDREECGGAKHTPDFEPGSCDTGARTCTAHRRRQLLEVGAVCGKPARTDLCGGGNSRPYRKPGPEAVANVRRDLETLML